MGRCHHENRRLDAIRTLLRVRDLELRRAQVEFRRQQRKVLELESDVLRLKKRCEQLHPGGDGNLLERRRTLDALIKVKLARAAELDCAKREVIDLLPALHSAQGRRDVVFRLWSRRRLDREVAALRRQETAAADLAAARLIVRRTERGAAAEGEE